MEAHTLSKSERLCSKKLIETLFSGKGRSMSAFPVRVVYLKLSRTEHEPQAEMLVSVPKRCFKRAVKRNRVKRQVREAFRMHKQQLLDKMKDHADEKLIMAFIWLDDKLHDSTDVESRISVLVNRISEKL